MWVVKIRNTSEAVLRPQYSAWHYTDCGPVGLGQYNSLGKYCDPHTASSMFLILIQSPVLRGHVDILIIWLQPIYATASIKGAI